MKGSKPIWAERKEYERFMGDGGKEFLRQAAELLKKYFGYDMFRKGQEELILAILSGQDVLGIMPTGAGKSICYQVPALLLAGVTLVISPLISLMKDQVQALNQAGVHAAYINSSLSDTQISKALRLAAAGQYKLSTLHQNGWKPMSFYSLRTV